jgi:hypothetical protein
VIEGLDVLVPQKSKAEGVRRPLPVELLVWHHEFGQKLLKFFYKNRKTLENSRNFNLTCWH